MAASIDRELSAALRLHLRLRLPPQRTALRCVPAPRGTIAKDEDRGSAPLLRAFAVKEVGALFAFWAALATMVPSAGFARTVPPVPQAREATTLWGQASGYRLETTIRFFSVSAPVRGRSLEDTPVAFSKTPKFGGEPKVDSGSDGSPRFGRTGREGTPTTGRANKHFNLETVTVTVLGRRFVFSRFTVNRRGVHGTLSTGF